ncbi:MAG: ribosome-associated translation inhibitor RaiA [Oscillospiraceae bacterium]|nr:ribosome-associated translation inhibitor RaiA [Oscillospiraceae bacterium]
MKIEIHDRNTMNPTGVHEYAEKKVGKLNRYFHKDIEARVVMTKERAQQKCEITINVDGLYFRSTVGTTDMYASVDACVAHIERQIRKHRTKLEKRLKAIEPHEDYDLAVDDSDAFSVLRRKTFNMKPMTSEEAILQMQLLSHAFFMFRDSDSGGAVSVVYSRNDGGYGVISEA